MTLSTVNAQFIPPQIIARPSPCSCDVSYNDVSNCNSLNVTVNSTKNYPYLNNLMCHVLAYKEDMKFFSYLSAPALIDSSKDTIICPVNTSQFFPTTNLTNNSCDAISQLPKHHSYIVYNNNTFDVWYNLNSTCHNSTCSYNGYCLTNSTCCGSGVVSVMTATMRYFMSTC
ncbi:hypothetical protein HELRODRAFT_159989 [Helobdella robusta]|uniref:Uncharacterized protein n=1 Tax=Helobdella robusta TaxID=6412 RepID=T1EPM5_HELRO|nr:hypothetical protein HELRODRAFT_159989 [Helobdella robusta]ESO05898.1 hypothetical protein HELRODRAFT_159989 [Helobdella robusta]